MIFNSLSGKKPSSQRGTLKVYSHYEFVPQIDITAFELAMIVKALGNNVQGVILSEEDEFEPYLARHFVLINQKAFWDSEVENWHTDFANFAEVRKGDLQLSFVRQREAK